MNFLIGILAIVMMVYGFRGIASIFVIRSKELSTAFMLAIIMIIVIPMVMVIIYLVDGSPNMNMWVDTFMFYFKMLGLTWLVGSIIYLGKYGIK